MCDPFLDKISEFVTCRSRLSFSGHKREMLRHRLANRMEQLELANFEAYWLFLKQTPTEEISLLDCLTTNETFFYRNPDQFNHLREVIIPELETVRWLEIARSWEGSNRVSISDVMKLRILSAGCSTGEEAYSIAMVLLEALRHPKTWKVEIIAGDLNSNCLKTAAKGYYENDKLKNIPERYVARYMQRDVDGARINDEVKQLVTFIPLNLNRIMNGEPFSGSDAAASPFDIIFCRNVMIYFAASCQQILVDTLHHLLIPGGYLFTGDAEPLHLFNHSFKTISEASCLIYKKTEMTNHADAL